MNLRCLRTPSRWAWVLPAAATLLIAACEDSIQPGFQQQTWGFLMIDARKAAGGQHYIQPEAFFFKGTLTSVPNASLVIDSCVDATYNPSNNLSGVTYLDAGTPLTTLLSGRLDTLPRNSSATGTTYSKPTGVDIAYNPGDSVVMNVTGSVGGYPAAEIRAKTAESFSLDPVTVPTGNNAIQLRWTPGSDFNSAMILSLRYSPPGASGTLTRQVLCSFADDGIDSIPFRQYSNWSTNAGSPSNVVATRLRTTFKSVGDGLLEVISTYSVPTPAR